MTTRIELDYVKMGIALFLLLGGGIIFARESVLGDFKRGIKEDE